MSVRVAQVKVITSTSNSENPNFIYLYKWHIYEGLHREMVDIYYCWLHSFSHEGAN